jgi:prepilin-type N-terminal cleavage/methylation domain-containing protein
MNRKPINRGFTLIEILVAMAMVALVFALVYGANSAITRAVRAYNARRDLVLPAKKVIEQMARQIRCAYAPSASDIPGPTGTSTETNESATEKGFAYFSGNCPDKPGTVLRLVTTSGKSAGHYPTDGLFEAAYKFDKAAGVLFYEQRQFAPVGENPEENWQPVAGGIDRINLTFFDGKTWQQSWDLYDQKQRLPIAVSIEITLKGEHNFQYRYETVAFAWSAQTPPTESRQLASARKQ